jgi:hypothetical protein
VGTNDESKMKNEEEKSGGEAVRSENRTEIFSKERKIRFLFVP